MEAGTIFTQNNMNYLVCHALNDLSVRINVPMPYVQQIQAASQVSQLKWPLGIYVAFTPKGLTVGIFGQRGDQLSNGMSSIDFSEDVEPEVGPLLWDLWKKYRTDSESKLVQNLQTLTKITEEALALEASTSKVQPVLQE